MNQVRLAFAQAIAESGLTPPEIVKADGKIHRFATHPNGRDDAGWYVLYGDGWPAGAFGDHRSGEMHRWKAPKDVALSSGWSRGSLEPNRYYVRTRERDEHQRAAQERAANIWLGSKQPDLDHPYLVSKGIPPTLIRQVDDRLVIPIDDPLNGSLMSLQFVYPEGQKRYLSGAKRAGGLLYIPGAGPKVCVCEGYATGITIHMATGSNVVVAFDCGNLTAVLLSVRAHYDGASIVVCADDDIATPGNPGLSKAKEAADLTGAILASPLFDSHRDPTDTDFNDMYRRYGLVSVRDRIRSVIESETRYAKWDRQMYCAAAGYEYREFYASGAPAGLESPSEGGPQWQQ